ncbi:NTP/NDP exchange transporter [Gilvimarinus sp. F26214L]|uniref:NTP/NDP exchange transporter n=1 Tax=Gilvimarinus sp. DZF01 TaxID=3461371 RepID=UPI004046150C
MIKTWGDRLGALANVRREEWLPVLLAALYFFCVLTALMVVRPARDALGMQQGIESLRWIFFGTALITLLVNPVFGWLVSRLRRMTFISATYGFFATSFLLFYGLLVFAPDAVGERSGQVFYVWFSVFNLFSTMVFWALMADCFSLEQSKRFFALIAVGGTCGAIAGPWLATMLAQPLGTANLLLIAVLFLMLALACAWMLTRRQLRGGSKAMLRVDNTAIGGSPWAGLRAVIQSRYLLGISAYVIILTIMATFIYFTRLQMVAALGEDVDMRTAVFARIDLLTQVATLLLQAVVAGRVMKRLGVAATLALLPLTVALGFIGLAIVGSLVALVVFEASFRAVQRALTRPARETLFTVVGREEKYKAKAFIDTFVYRTGDIVGAQTEGVLSRTALGLSALTAVALPLALAWALLGFWLGRQQARMRDADCRAANGHGRESTGTIG